MKKILFLCLGLIFSVPAMSATLPKGYTQVEYLQSDGGQIINTGYVVRETDSVEVDYTLTDLTRDGDKFIIGAQPVADNPNVGFWVETYGSLNNWFVRFGSSISTSNDGATPSSQLSGTFVVSKNSFVVNGTKILEPNFSGMSPNPMTIFNRYNSNGTLLTNGGAQTGASVQISEVRIKNGNNIVRKYVPARYNNELGLYETTQGQFFTNLGTGSFTSGNDVAPENIYAQHYAGYIDGYFKTSGDNRVITAYASNSILILNTEVGKTYTLKNTKTLMKAYNGTRIYSSNVMPVVGTIYTPDQFYTITDATTWVEGVTFTAKDIYTALLARGDSDGSANHDFAYIAEGLELYEVYQSPIKIATTKYNAARFDPVVTALNTAIGKIKDVVATTIEQTKAVASLQADKQQRPSDTACPEYRQCLLVEDENGTPHWYEIMDPFYNLFSAIIPNNVSAGGAGVTNGYTQLEYIKSTRSIVLKDYTTDNTEIEAKFYRESYDTQYVYQSDASASLQTNTGAYLASEDIRGAWRFGDQNDSQITNTNTLYTSIQNKNGVWINGTRIGTYSNVSSFTSTIKLRVLSTSQTAPTRLYYIIHRENGNVIAHYVPCVAPDNSIGLCDIVGGGFYTNAEATITAGNAVANSAGVPGPTTWSMSFGANPPLDVRYSVVGSAICNATSGTANTAATSTQMTNANWTASGNYCWCSIDSVTDQNGNSSTGKNIWVWLAVPSGETCASNCAENCATEMQTGTNTDFRHAMTGI